MSTKRDKFSIHSRGRPAEFSISQRHLLGVWQGEGRLEVPLGIVGRKGGTKKTAYSENLRQLLIELDSSPEIVLSSVKNLSGLVSSKKKISQEAINGKTHDIYRLTKEQTKELIPLFSSDLTSILEDDHGPLHQNPRHPIHFHFPEPTTPSSKFTIPNESRKRRIRSNVVEQKKIPYRTIFDTIETTCLNDVLHISEVFNILDKIRASGINKKRQEVSNPVIGTGERQYGRDVRGKIHKVRDDYGIKLNLRHLPPDKFRIETTDGKLLRETYYDLKELKETYERAHVFISNESKHDKLSRFMDGLLGGDYLMTYNDMKDLCMTIPGGFKEYLNDDRRLKSEMKLVLRYCAEELKEMATTEQKEYLKNLDTSIGWDCEFLLDYNVFKLA